MNALVKDPVCHMDVAADSFHVEYLGVPYAFCSMQCKERFVENPHLYIGVPGRKAPAQLGTVVIKRRRFVLAAPLNAMQADLVKQALFEMMGMQAVNIDGDQIEIQYDLMQVAAEQIADQLVLIGAKLGESWVDRLKLGFINYLEECEIGSMEVKPPKSCH